MKVCIVGTGYVGLVTGTCLAEMGNTVICVDVDPERIAALKQGVIPIYEPGLKDLVESNSATGRLSFTTELVEGLAPSLLCFICVGTPQDEDGSADLQYVLKVADQIGELMDGYRIVIDKSTVPVGTAEKVRARIQDRLAARGMSHIEFDVVSNPEFLKEGNAVQDFMRPERIVVGTDNVRTAEILKELYAPFVSTSSHPVIVMDVRSAELTKYASNAFLATKITFMNELAILCDKLGADISQVRHGMGTDERIGPRFLLAGPGYGGSCFPKDVRAIMATAREHDHELMICAATHQANERQKRYVAEKVIAHYAVQLTGDLTIAVWGLTFKPKTDDVRESPAITIINALLEEDIRIKAYDPEGLGGFRKIMGDKVQYAEDAYTALEDVDGVVIVPEWNQFKSPDFLRMLELMRTPVVFDVRNILNGKELEKLGFMYFGIGRGR